MGHVFIPKLQKVCLISVISLQQYTRSLPSLMPIQKLYTNLQGFLGFSCSVRMKRPMQTLVRLK